MKRTYEVADRTDKRALAEFVKTTSGGYETVVEKSRRRLLQAMNRYIDERITLAGDVAATPTAAPLTPHTPEA